MATASPRDSAHGLTASARLHAASCLMAAALLAVLCCRASCGEGALFRRSGHRAVGLTAAQARSGFEIPDVLIIAGSDSLSVWGEPLLRGADYSIDPETRTLRLLSALPDTTRLILRYAHLPLGLAPVYQRARAETSASLPPGFPRGPALVEDTGAGRAAEPLGAGLRVGGAKTFGITVGSDRDLSLEQSLRVSVSGSITDDVAVNAYLSDQNTPLVPEGDTEELRALDKVLIELTGERVSATMGDYELAIDGGSLATVRRELSGAKVTAEVGPGTVLLAGARLRGEFTSVTLAGVDGKQGPYLLTDRSGAAGVVVVAGSERVWLDGEQLARGRDRDYVIDYAAGEIELTERRPVSSDNTITVDYEYALGDYGRDIYGGRGVLPLFGGAASVGASFMREVDDRTAGEGAVLSDEDVAILEAAGDDPSLAHDDGVEYTGAGEGDYVLVEEGVFEYAGADSGDYDLSFERADGGDYDYDYVRGAYVHVGPGEGDYRLGRSLPRPIDRGLAAADVRFALPGGGSVVAEGAVSNFDRNTFSDLDDGDNTGNAELMSARLPAIGLGGDAAELALGVSARRVGGRFEGIGRFRELRYEEKWELQGLELPEREALVEGTAALTLRGGGRFDLSYGRLERGDELGSSKAEFSVTARPNGRSRVWANGRLVDLDYAAADSVLARRRTLYRAGVEHSIGFVVPSAVYSHDERSTDRGGERYDEYGGSLASSGRGAYSFRAAYSRRLTDRSDGDSWGRASTTRTQEYALGLSGSDRLTVDASVLRRAIDVEPGLDEPGSRYDLASLRLGHRSFDGAVSGEARYTVTATEIEEKERYVTVEDGVEITRVVPTGRYVPVTDLSAGTRWTVAFRRSSGSRALPDARALARFLAGVSLETDVKLREVSTTDDHRRLYLLSPDVIQGAETVRGEISARHAARYAAPGGRLSVRLSLSSRDELDRSYTNASDARKERAGTIDVKVSHGRSLVYRAQADLASRDQRASGAGSSYEIRESSLLAEATVSAWTELELRLTGSLTRQDERLAAADVTIVRITPAATYRLKGRGALSLSVTRAEVESTLDALPSYLGQGSPPGVTSEWRLSGDYRLNRYLTGSLSYTGEARPGAETRHTLDMRVNAYF